MNKKRIVIIALLLALTVSLFGVSAAADTTPIEVGEDVLPDTTDTVENTESGDVADGTEDEGDNEMTKEGEENAFSLFFEGVKTYATEILSALTLIASLVLAYAYKSGLTPVITNALTNLGKLLAGMRESASENEKVSKEITAAIGERLEAAEATVAKLTESIEAVTENLRHEEESAGERKKLSAVLEAQIDMMYSLFISSALPEYQKVAVAEKIEKMKEAIADAEK